MNLCAPFVRRPVATTLLAIGLLLVGVAAHRRLPVTSLPSVDLPTIRVSASRPGADPETMAASVAAPLERSLAAISGVTEITSVSGLGSATIAVQFDLSRKIDKAAQDVQAAINAAAADLPSDMPTLPTARKANPAAAPVLILALTSKTRSSTDIYDAADTILVQRLSQVEGVSDVSVSGAEQPAVRVEFDPATVNAAGLTLEQIRTAIVNTNALGPLGSFDGQRQAEPIALNGQLATAAEYRNVVIRAANGTVLRLTDVATVIDGVKNRQAAGTYDGKPAVILTVTKAADANVVETVRRVRELLPTLERYIPADIEVSVMSDRTTTIRASIEDMQWTLLLSVFLVMGVVFLFLGRTVPTVAAGVTIPLAFAGTFAGMWAMGFTLDNLSLMALAISVGFVVDDAIVVIESVIQRIEKGEAPLKAAIDGAGGIAFTVLSISLSMVAAFLPLMFLGGIVGQFFKEFALTVVFAIAFSTLVALTVTPMICGRYLKAGSEAPSRFGRFVDRQVARIVGAYGRSLDTALRHGWLMLLVTLAVIGLTGYMFTTLPKGYFPRDDTGLLGGGTRASPDVSFAEMKRLQDQAARIVASDPAVAHVGSFIGSSGWISSVNSGRLFVALKPLEERGGIAAQDVIARLRVPLQKVPGVDTFLFPVQDVRAGARQGRSEYQLTLWSADIGLLRAQAERATQALQRVEGLVDVSNDQERGGLQANVTLDRDAIGRLGVAIPDVDGALNNAFSQRQVATIYRERNQYRVVMGVRAGMDANPDDLNRIYVPTAAGGQVPLGAVATLSRSLSPLVVSHQGQFPSVTISYGLDPSTTLGEATPRIRAAIDNLHLPEGVHAEFAGDAADFNKSAGSQTVLIVAALLTIYILLGILYESLIHPLTILSTLPSAGLGALIALKAWHLDLTLVALIGIILLIGIVKKNGIMLVDRALEALKEPDTTPREAIGIAARERFRPILMTTIAAMLGALPLLLGEGPGSELRRPLGVTIVGGLFVSQVLTLYTTPAIYLMFERLRGRFFRKAAKTAASPSVPV